MKGKRKKIDLNEDIEQVLLDEVIALTLYEDQVNERSKKVAIDEALALRIVCNDLVEIHQSEFSSSRGTQNLSFRSVRFLYSFFFFFSFFDIFSQEELEL
jgi:hypothetical protein